MKLSIFKPEGTMRPDKSDATHYLKNELVDISIEKTRDGSCFRFHPLHEGTPLRASWWGELNMSDGEMEQLKDAIENLLKEYPEAQISEKPAFGPILDSIGLAIGREMKGKADTQAILFDILKNMALKIAGLEERIKAIEGK